MKLLLQARIRGCDGQSRHSALRHTARVCLRASRLLVPVSLRVCTLSRRTFMNNAGSQDAEKVRKLCSRIAQRLDVRKRVSRISESLRAFPFAKIHSRGERPTRSEVCTSSPPRSLRPCLGQGASRRARVGRVRSLAFLSILKVNRQASRTSPSPLSTGSENSYSEVYAPTQTASPSPPR
jgi:hypothetical protein